MIGDDVQDLLDSLAVAVGRGVAVDDPGGQVVAHSVHHGEVDQVRAQAILSRSVPSEVRAWQEVHGVATARLPVRLPANPALGMVARLCVPLLHQDRRVGLLWIIEGDGPLNPEQEARAVRDAATIAALLDDGGGSGMLRGLLVGGITPGQAGGVLGEGPLRLLVLRGGQEDRGRVVGAELARMRRPPVFAVLDRHVVLLLGGGDDAPGLAERLIACAEGGVAAGPGVSAGISAVHAGLESARDAYREAVAAARAAAADPALGPVARWPELGVYRLLAEPTATPLGALREHPALAVTLEAYLDSGGDAQETAGLLHLHRTSLYYRLARIEEVTGRSLKDGADRLELHLALKLARWNAV